MRLLGYAVMIPLEWVADAKVDAYGVKRGGDIEIGVDRFALVSSPTILIVPLILIVFIFIRLVWRMDGHTKVQTDH